MIDTDKYEWDSKCRLVVIDGELYQRGSNGDYHISQQLHDPAVAQLIADAPLLLEEVKRLREQLKRAYDWVNGAFFGNDSTMMDYTEYVEAMKNNR